MASLKYNLDELRALREEWEKNEPLIDALDEKTKDIYTRRKKAVDMYLDGCSMSTVVEDTKISRTELHRFIPRMMERKAGVMWGYSALLPYGRIAKSTRVIEIDPEGGEAGAYSGAFSDLLSRYEYEGIIDFIMDTYHCKGRAKTTNEVNISLRNLHKAFLRKLMEFGVTMDEYPFNTNDQGYRSLCRFVHEHEETHIRANSRRKDKNSAQVEASTGFGRRHRADVIAPYSIVQVDGHKLDILYVTDYEDEHGELHRDCAMRPWLFVLIDVATRAVLGYCLTPYENYNSTDVLKAFKHALNPKTQMSFTLKNMSYPENGGFPDTAYEDLQYAIFDTVMLDNAKCHLADDTIRKLVDILKCNVNFGSVATPETRGVVERFFGKYESFGFHRLPGSVGSSPKDPRFAKAMQEAIDCNITYEIVSEIVEWSIVEINNSPSRANENLTPLQAMGEKLKRGEVPAIASESMMKEVNKLHYLQQPYTIKGSAKQGRRPYIFYKGATYRSDIISTSYAYAGKKVILSINPDNIQTIDVYDSDTGEFIDTVEATGGWGQTPHSLRTRNAANKRMRKNMKTNTTYPFEDPVMALREELEAKAKSSRRSRTKASIIAREQQIENPTATSIGQQEVVDFSEASQRLKEASGDSIVFDDGPSLEEMRKEIQRIGAKKFYELYGDKLK